MPRAGPGPRSRPRARRRAPARASRPRAGPAGCRRRRPSSARRRAARATSRSVGRRAIVVNRSTRATVTRCGSIHTQTTRRHRAAITAVFAGNGVLFASLFSRLPEIQERLGLDEGALGLVLLAAPVGPGRRGACWRARRSRASGPGAWRPSAPRRTRRVLFLPVARAERRAAGPRVVRARRLQRRSRRRDEHAGDRDRAPLPAPDLRLPARRVLVRCAGGRGGRRAGRRRRASR